MEPNTTFEKILEEKMGITSKFNLNPAPFCPVTPRPGPPISPIFLNRRFQIPRAGLKAYPQKCAPQRPDSQPQKQEILKKTPTAPMEPRLHSQMFSITGQKRMARLIELGAQLDPLTFTMSQLKQEYRSLLKRYHPDLNRARTAALTLSQVVELYRGLCLEIKKLELSPQFKTDSKS